jgi:hypothetical protein
MSSAQNEGIDQADNVTSSGLDLIAGAPLGGSAVVDVYVSVNPGLTAELLIG